MQQNAWGESFKPYSDSLISRLRDTAISRREAVRRALQIGASTGLSRLEQWLVWLATTGAVTPFIGLFGAVWGIIDAFHGLATAGTASLHSVAPGIAEALITTAAGLFAAIPAVIAYNIFLQRIKEFGAQLDDFALEFLNMTERYFTD